jgi:hypothetical protein
MTEQGQAVMDRQARLAALERGELPPCAVCDCPWRRHLGRSGVGQCQCGCPRYRDAPDEPELKPELTAAERRRAAHERTRNQYMDELIHGRKGD